MFFLPFHWIDQLLHCQLTQAWFSQMCAQLLRPYNIWPQAIVPMQCDRRSQTKHVQIVALLLMRGDKCIQVT